MQNQHRLKLIARGFLLITSSIFLIPLYLLSYPLGDKIRWLLSKSWCALVHNLLGIKVKVINQPYHGPSVLFVSNHVSPLDILILGAQLNAMFIAKQEIADWPLFGFLAKLARTQFISRKASHAKVQHLLLRKLLSKGKRLILFPEGTRTDGKHLLPFKSSLFAVAYPENPEQQDTIIQPVSIAYTRLNDGLPLAGKFNDYYAFYGEIGLVSHLKKVIGGPGAEVEIRFHQPVSTRAYNSRKELAVYCQNVIARGVALSQDTVEKSAAL